MRALWCPLLFPSTALVRLAFSFVMYYSGGSVKICTIGGLMKQLALLLLVIMMRGAYAQCDDGLLFHSFLSADQLVAYTIVDTPGMVGGASNWYWTTAGTLRQSSNVYLSGDAYPDLHGSVAWLSDRCWTDCRFDLSVKPGDNDDWGLYFRSTLQEGEGFGYRLSFNNDQHPGLYLNAGSNGNWTELIADTDFRYGQGSWQNLGLVLSGSQISVFWQDTLVFSLTDETFSQGGIGLFVRAMSPIEFDNLLVQPLTGVELDPYVDSVVDYVIQPGNETNNYTNPLEMLGAPDQQFVALGGDCSGNSDTAWIILDMGPDDEAILNGPGVDFEIVELGAATGGVDEYYEVWVSNSATGPWTYLALGNGSQSFDLDDAGKCAARYLKLVDLSTTTCNTGTPGCDLDGVVAYYPGPHDDLPQPVIHLDQQDGHFFLRWNALECADAYRVYHRDLPYEGEWNLLEETTGSEVDLGLIPDPFAMGFYQVEALEY